jgi:hypothetical protein
MLNGSGLGTVLQQLLMSDSVTPGSEPGYQLCKTIYSWHPLGAKMADRPVREAQSKPRKISVVNAPEEAVTKAFITEWYNVKADDSIKATMTLARIYGIGALIVGVRDVPTNEPLNMRELVNGEIYFNALDPLNTSGSLVLNQDPNAPDFQKHGDITANGQTYHRSRACVVTNEQPIYIEYTSSAFGFVGRSVYQRALYPLKTFIQSMLTDDLIIRKSGVLVAKIKQPGSIVNNLASRAMGIKRSLLKEASTDNVISLSPDEDVQSLDMHNADTAITAARKNVIENIAAASDMPAKFLNSESFAEGFGEGGEDAKAMLRYLNDVRRDMKPLYDFMDNIVQHRAWNPAFYETIQAQFPEEYGNVDYDVAFNAWRNSFVATWPSLDEEPESELQKIDETALKGITEILRVILPNLDPENRASMIDWAAMNLNSLDRMFKSDLVLDIESLRNYTPPQPMQPEAPRE